jgi:hypothetical protein
MDLLSEYSVTSPSPITIRHGITLPYDANFPAPSFTTATLGDGHTYTNVVTDSSIQATLSAEIAAKRITPDANTLFMVFVPPGDPVQAGGADSITSFVAYHSYYHDSGSNKDVVYAVMPTPGPPNYYYPPLSYLQLEEMALSHEFAEAITDPTFRGWWDSATGAEIGDLAAYSYSNLRYYPNPTDQPNYYDFTAQNEFSNNAKGIVVPRGATLYISGLSNPTEGPFNGVIASFFDTTGGGSLSSASIDWGDGSVPSNLSSLTVTPAPGVPNTYLISGSHTYTADEGAQYDLDVQITTSDGRRAERSGLGVFFFKKNAAARFGSTDLGLVTLTDAPLTPLPVNVPGTVGQGLSNVVVAKFNDPGTDGTGGDYKAKITWTDSSGRTRVTFGTVVFESGTTLDVLGTSNFTYAAAGNFPISVTITDDGGSSTTVSSIAQIASGSGSFVLRSGVSSMNGGGFSVSGQGGVSGAVAPLTAGTASPSAPLIGPVVLGDVASDVAIALGDNPGARRLVPQTLKKSPFGTSLDPLSP